MGAINDRLNHGKPDSGKGSGSGGHNRRLDRDQGEHVRREIISNKRTIRELADELDVSPSVVGRSLSDTPSTYNPTNPDVPELSHWSWKEAIFGKTKDYDDEE